MSLTYWMIRFVFEILNGRISLYIAISYAYKWLKIDKPDMYLFLFLCGGTEVLYGL